MNPLQIDTTQAATDTGPARPPEEVERRSDRIASLAMQGLHILTRHGVQDKELRLVLLSQKATCAGI